MQRGIHSIFTYNSNLTEAEKVVALADELGVKAVALRLDTANTATFDDFVGSARKALAALINDGGRIAPQFIVEVLAKELGARGIAGRRRPVTFPLGAGGFVLDTRLPEQPLTKI